MICNEALKKLDDFSTKAIIKLMDSVYVTPVKEHRMLEDALTVRTNLVAQVIQNAWPNAESLMTPNVDAYTTQIQDTGLIDCGLVGTPLLLTDLGIGLPSRDFILLCRRKAWLETGTNGERRPIPPNGGRQEFTAASCDIIIGEKEENIWLLRDAGETSQAADAVLARIEVSARLLTAVELPGRRGRNDSTFAILVELIAAISSLGVDVTSVEQCSNVEGRAQLLSTTVPCISTVGALRQFNMLFPKITLEFTEQVSDREEYRYLVVSNGLVWRQSAHRLCTSAAHGMH